jgi:hypothetical protein
MATTLCARERSRETGAESVWGSGAPFILRGWVGEGTGYDGGAPVVEADHECSVDLLLARGGEMVTGVRHYALISALGGGYRGVQGWRRCATTMGGAQQRRVAVSVTGRERERRADGPAG